MARYSKAAYVEISTALRMLYDNEEQSGRDVPGRGKVAEVLADIFANDNPLFERERFMAAVRSINHGRRT